MRIDPAATQPAGTCVTMGPMATPPFEVLRPEQLRRRTSIKWQHYGPDVLPLWVAEMDVLPAPEVVDALCEAVRLGDTGYPNSGTPYKEALGEFAQSRWGWNADPADMLLCADVMTGIRVLIERFSPPRGTVVIPSPVYPPLAGSSREAGRQVVEVALTAQGRLDLPALEAALAASAAGAADHRTMLLLCSPHNPTGVVHTAEELLAVARAAQRHAALVVVDEVHAPLVPLGATFVPWLAVADHGFVVTSAAKGFNLAGLKAGLIVAGRAMRAQLRRLPDSVAHGGSHLGVIAHAAAYRSDPSWLDAVNANIVTNRVLLAALLAERLPGVGYRVPEATYLAWLDMRRLGLGDDPAGALLTHGHVALQAGRPFGRGGLGHARVNVACSREVLTEAVDRMAIAVAARAGLADGPRA
jgi:cysteine-S-conjugate beta-lyase